MRTLTNGLMLATVLACTSAVPTPANDAALNQGMFGPEPLDVSKGEESPIQMVQESLHFRFGKEETQVHCRFLFRNLDTTRTARQLTGFPDLRLAWQKEIDEGRRDPDEVGCPLWNAGGILHDMETTINGQVVSSQIRYGYSIYPNGGYWKPTAPDSGCPIAWYVAELNIPPGGEAVLERRYRAQNGFGAGVGWTFDYRTDTGAGWAGKIGGLAADVQLLDGLTISDLRWDDESRDDDPGADHGGMRPHRREWIELAPDRLQCTWLDFDPVLDEDRDCIRIVYSLWRAQDEIIPGTRDAEPPSK